MAARTTGFALLSSAWVQEAHDAALIAQAATLETRIPFLHFFDGSRTSHEVNTLTLLTDTQIRALIDPDLVRAHRARALTPEHPVIRGTAHSPDTLFQARETVNPYYEQAPAVVQATMDRFAALAGRRYRLFEYSGSRTPNTSPCSWAPARPPRERRRRSWRRPESPSACYRCASTAPSPLRRFCRPCRKAAVP